MAVDSRSINVIVVLASSRSFTLPGASLFPLVTVRLDALENGTDPDRAATKQAVAFLATRSFDRSGRERLKGLVDVTVGPTSPLPETTALPQARDRAGHTSHAGQADGPAAQAGNAGRRGRRRPFG
ncbi:hypothetical protein [Sorangium sp. So ce1335]|uniref:hypothetical protein n=1 Tax=Sorangium sp. So ce1335 TaxID=3133335 RepID=UPI003F6458E2